MAKIELKTEELVGLLQQMQGGAMGRPAPASSVMGQEAPRRSAEENLGMFQTLRAARPVESPAAPGTITQARRQADEQAKLQREQMAQQMAIARMNARARSGGGSSFGNMSKGQVAGWIKGLADEYARQGHTYSQVVQKLQDPQYFGIWESGVMKLDEAVKLAKQYYEPHLSAPPSSRSFGQAVNTKYPTFHEGFDYAPAPSAHLDRAMQDLLKTAGQGHQKIQQGTFKDPVTGKLYNVDPWGTIIYEGDPRWGNNDDW